MVERGRVTGVRIAGRNEEPDELLKARKVVSAIGIPATIERLLPEQYRSSSWGQSVRDLQPSSAYVCLFIGFEGDIREAGASNANYGFFDSWDIEASGRSTDRPCRSCSVHVDMLQFAQGPKHVGPHTGEVMALIPWKHFQEWSDTNWKQRPQEYEDLKAALSNQLLEQFLEHMPSLRPYVAWAELSTPLSATHFVRSVDGAIYGLDHTPQRYSVTLSGPDSNSRLYMAGTETVCVGC